jgi:hypothetical protein
VRTPSDSRFARTIRGPGLRSTLLWLASVGALIQCETVCADVYKCVGVGGATIYSDAPCDSKPNPPPPQTAADPSTDSGAARRVPVVPANSANLPVRGFDLKIHQLLLLTQLAPPESPGLSEVARSLVPKIDSSLRDALQDPRWGPLSNLIQADIRPDMPQLAHSFAQSNQSLVRVLASRIQESDVDALSVFFRSPTGVSYLAFLGEMRTVYVGAVRSVLGHLAAQTPISQSNASPPVLKTRLMLVSLGFDAASFLRAQDTAHRVSDPSPYAAEGITPEQIVAVEGTALDTLAARFEISLAAFKSFDESPTTRHFFSSVGQPIAATTTEITMAMRDFADAEQQTYGGRWKLAYRRGIYSVGEPTSIGVSLSRASGPSPIIRFARYASPRNGRAFDVTYALQTACPHNSVGCRVACGNQLAGDPDFGQPKYCQISFQCGSRPAQEVRLDEGRTLTLACAP